MSEVSVTANVPQGQFLAMPHKFRAFVAGFGSGKTVVGCMNKCIHMWEHPKINQGYFAPTFGHIRDIFYPTIEEVAHWFGLKVDIKEGNREAHYYNGRCYRGVSICRSMDSPENIIGFKIGHAMIDEYDLLPMNKAKMAWRKVIARMRYNDPDLKNGIDVTTTPEGFRATYELFVSALEEDPGLSDMYGLIQASTYQNAANLPADYIDSLERTYPKELISAYLNGQFVNLTSGTVYRNFDRLKCHTSETIDNQRDNSGNKIKDTLLIGMDFNVNNMSAVVFVRRNEKELHAVDEIEKGVDTPWMCEELRRRYGNRTIIIYPDASGGTTTSKDASVSDISILRRNGFRVKVNPRNPRVKDRVLSMNTGFDKGKIMVNTHKCKAFSKCLEQQAYNKNGEPDKDTGFDHLNDAAGYVGVMEYPVRKPIERWDVKIAH